MVRPWQVPPGRGNGTHEERKAMALKFRAKSKEEIPAELQSLYVERDGAFVLDVEGAVDRARVDEVRASNSALTSQLAEQKRRFEGIESEQVKAIAAERDALSSKLTAIQVDQGAVTVATKKGLRPTAIPDITARARIVFKLVDGAPRAYEADGQERTLRMWEGSDESDVSDESDMWEGRGNRSCLWRGIWTRWSEWTTIAR
jgi:hypothetical protein